MNVRRGRNYGARRKRDSATQRAPSFSSLVSLASQLGVQQDETVRGLLRAVQYTHDPEIAQEAFEYLERLALEQTLDPDPFAPPVAPEEAWGKLDLGAIPNAGCQFGLRPDELTKHTLVTGSSGTGKTTLITRLYRQIVRAAPTLNPSPRILVFDIKKDYQKLAREFPDVWEFTLPGADFRWNPLEPPIPGCERWAGIFAATLSNAAGFYGGQSTENFIYKSLLELYRRYDTERGAFPCLLDFRDYLYWLNANKKIDRYSEEHHWFVRVLNRLESLCSAFGETVNCSCGYPLAEVLAHHTIFDIAELKPDAQGFFTETYLTEVVQYRMAKGERGGELRTLAGFDEGKRLMPRYREESQQSVSNISNAIAMGREFGIGFVVAECDPALLANSIKASAYTRVCFNQTHGNDILDSARSLGLDPAQAAVIQQLGTGEAIVRLAGRIGRPFPLKVTP